MRTGIVTSAVAAIFVSVLISGGAQAGTTVYSFATPTSITVAEPHVDTPGAWYIDRYPSNVFAAGATAPDGRSGVLEEGIAASDFQGVDSYNDWQGYEYDVNLSGPVQSISIDLYVSQAMLLTQQEYSVFITANGVNSSNQSTGFPQFDFGTLGPVFTTPDGTRYGPGTVGFNDGGSNGLVAVTTPGWYNLDMVLTVGTGMQYFVNGVSCLTTSDPYTTNLPNFELDSLNFGSSYDTYWDNLTTTSTPEPISLVFFGTGLVAVGGFMARRRMPRKA